MMIFHFKGFTKVCNVALSVGACAVLLLLSNAYQSADTIDINFQDCIVWGPGIYSQSVLPVRYFYIQLVDRSGAK